MDNPNPIMYSIDSGMYFWLIWECICFAHLLMAGKEFHYDVSIPHHWSKCSQYIYSGADGVFAINKTSGCIILKVYPADLRREVYNIKVKVKSPASVFSCIRSLITRHCWPPDLWLETERKPVSGISQLLKSISVHAIYSSYLQ